MGLACFVWLIGGIMLDQRINAKTFLKMTSLKDIIRYKLGRDKAEYLESLQSAIDDISNKCHNFDDVLCYEIKGKKVYKLDTVASLYYARHINRLLKRLYKVKQSNRDDITQQTNVLLQETSPFYVIKGDIANFYESIDRVKLISKLKSDRLLDLRHVSVIEKIFSCAHGSVGVPRGISFSSTLSELYVRTFDDAIRGMTGVYFYARYVDDFIIFTHDDSVNINSIGDELSKLGLELNRNKTHKYSSNLLYNGKQCITFLGYMHFIDDSLNAVIKIANKRIRKIKTRIVLSFLDFFKTKDFTLLELRVRFLTGNYIINTSQDKQKKLLAGFYYNNAAITEFSQISDLDRFLMRIVKSKSGFIPKGISVKLMRKLNGISKECFFYKGFNSRSVHEIDVEKFKAIKACWEREYIYEKKK